MPFTKANPKTEKKKLEKLLSSSAEARRAHDEFQARIALQQQLIEMRRAEHLTQSDVAKASGLSQQAVSRIEKGAGSTINSLIKYLTGVGYTIDLRKAL